MPENVGSQILKLKLLKMILMLSLPPVDALYPLIVEFKCPPSDSSNAFESSSCHLKGGQHINSWRRDDVYEVDGLYTVGRSS